MGVGPAYAIPKILKRSGINIEDVDLFEINEAFAGQALMCVDSLKLDQRKLNPNGGAIALGHPLGTCASNHDLANLASMGELMCLKTQELLALGKLQLLSMKRSVQVLG